MKPSFPQKKKFFNLLKNPWIVGLASSFLIAVFLLLVNQFYLKDDSTVNKLRRITFLEVDKPISSLPDKIFGYISGSSISFLINDILEGHESIGDLRFSDTKIDKYEEDFLFEVQKISKEEIYITGYISNESFSRIGEVEKIKNIQLVLFPKRFQEFSNPISIPLQSITEIESRTIEDDKGKTIIILELKTNLVTDEIRKK